MAFDSVTRHPSVMVTHKNRVRSRGKRDTCPSAPSTGSMWVEKKQGEKHRQTLGRGTTLQASDVENGACQCLSRFSPHKSILENAARTIINTRASFFYFLVGVTWPGTGVSNLFVSPGHTARIVLCHALNTLMRTNEQRQGLCIIFMITTTTDKQKSPHVVTQIMQWPFWQAFKIVEQVPSLWSLI